MSARGRPGAEGWRASSRGELRRGRYAHAARRSAGGASGASTRGAAAGQLAPGYALLALPLLVTPTRRGGGPAEDFRGAVGGLGGREGPKAKGQRPKGGTQTGPNSPRSPLFPGNLTHGDAACRWNQWGPRATPPNPAPCAARPSRATPPSPLHPPASTPEHT